MTQIDLMGGVMVLLALAMLVCLTGWMWADRTLTEEKHQRQEWMREACERAEALGQKDKALKAKGEELTALRDRAHSQETRLRELEGVAEELRALVKAPPSIKSPPRDSLSSKPSAFAELADDPRYEQMRHAYIALRAAGLRLTDDLVSYFGGTPLGPEGPPAKPKPRRVRLPFIFRHVDGAPAQLTILRRDIPADAERLVIETHADSIQVVDLLPPHAQGVR
jgi:hypothetical protein